MENFFIYTIWPLHEAGSSWQDGGCATPQPHPARRLTPSGLPKCSALRFSHFKGIRHERQKKGRRRTNRRAEMGDHPRHRKGKKRSLTEQAEIAGLSLSEYMRRRFFGGRIAAHTDLNTIAELRRIGGLLKHNFETLRQAKAPPDVFERQEEALRNLTWAIQKISLRCHYDCQENQEYEG